MSFFSKDLSKLHACLLFLFPDLFQGLDSNWHCLGVGQVQWLLHVPSSFPLMWKRADWEVFQLLGLRAFLVFLIWDEPNVWQPEFTFWNLPPGL